MYLDFPCTACKKTLKISEEHLGRKIHCPYCRQTQVPQAPVTVSEPDDPLGFLSESAPPAPTSPAKTENPLSFLTGTGPQGSDGHPTTTDEPKSKRSAKSSSTGTDGDTGGSSSRKKSDANTQIKFECSNCNQRLSVPPVATGLMVKCPSCGNRVRVPELQKTERQAWKETDPTNPHFILGLCIGVDLVLVWFGLLWPFVPGPKVPIAEYTTMQFIASLFYKHFTVSLLNTLFFTWSMSIIFLKHRKIRLQKAALLLDVLPTNLGKKIHSGNVAAFIDHVYGLPIKLRDSLMVNRIRKALELFEIRQNVSDVREMMVSQSEIDSARVGGSYTLLRAFLWGIPLLGFIGTVVGLSHAIGGMNFANVDDVGKVVDAINNVTSGLGTAFDATLLGLVLALTLNFPLNALAKQEDDNLHTIDAFCNEVLLPRLKDSSGSHKSDSAAIAHSVARSMAGAQEQFLADLNELARHMNTYADSLDSRMEAFQKTITQEFVAKTAEMRTQNQAAIEKALEQIVKSQEATANGNEELRAKTGKAILESSEQVATYLCGLEAGIGGLNKVLKELGEKQVVIASPRKRRWFGRN